MTMRFQLFYVCEWIILMVVDLHGYYVFCGRVQIACWNSGVGRPDTECGHHGRSGRVPDVTSDLVMCVAHYGIWRAQQDYLSTLSTFGIRNEEHSLLHLG